MNYTTLSTLLQDMTENTETTFVANIPNFVKQAEQRIYNAVLFPALRKLDTTLVCTSGNQYLNAPSDFLAVSSFSSIASGSHTFMLPKDVSFIRESYPNPTTDTGQPRHYSLFGPQAADEQELRFILGPTPDAAYTLELHYFFYPESIVTATSTWLSENFDPVLLYGALVEAYLFMKGEADLLKFYDDKFKEALMLAKKLGEGLERTDVYRNGMARA